MYPVFSFHNTCPPPYSAISPTYVEGYVAVYSYEVSKKQQEFSLANSIARSLRISIIMLSVMRTFGYVHPRGAQRRAQRRVQHQAPQQALQRLRSKTKKFQKKFQPRAICTGRLVGLRGPGALCSWRLSWLPLFFERGKWGGRVRNCAIANAVA